MSVESVSAQPAAPAKPRLRDVLSSPKMLVIMFLGAASGFPNQITESVLQLWLKDFGVTNTAIGILSYVAIPYLIKFLWAPLLDRYPLPFLGRRRGWILATQLASAAAIAVLAFQNPSETLMLIALCAIVIVFFSASQDIVIDAYKVDVAAPHERGMTAASANLGYRASAWIAVAFAAILADTVGWQLALIALAITMAAFAIVTVLAPEPADVAVPPRTLAESVIVPLRELFGTPGTATLVALVVLFKVGDAFALKLFTPFMKDVGFGNTEIAVVVKSVFTTTAILGSIVGGIWMVKLGLLRSMLLFGALQALSNLLYYLVAIVGKNYPLAVSAVAIDNFAGAMGNIASVALIMALCNKRFGAFQYALVSAFAMLPRYLLGGPAGWLADHGGWDVYYVVSFFLGLPGLALVWLLRERVKALDAPDR
ncbi:MAG TPA: MFS transporter [Steroidobacteraceae bacterium]